MFTTSEIAPCPALAPFVRCYALRELDTNGTDLTIPTHARHEIVLSFHFKSRPVKIGDAKSVQNLLPGYGGVVGLFTQGNGDLTLHGSYSFLEITFKPNGFSKIFRYRNKNPMHPNMNQIKKEDIKQEVFDLYDDYAHNRIGRREFIQKLSVYAVGSLTVASLMSFLMPDYKGAIQVKANDPRLKSEYVAYPSEKGGGTIKALLSMPVDAKEKLGGIVVVHENRGLNPHIEDVARRAALAGFISIAPDALTPLGGYPGTDDAGRELQSKRDKNEMLEDFIAAYDYLVSHKNCNGKVGVVGFCFGGWIANMMAVRIPGLSAAVPFYGSQPSIEDVPKIKAPLLLHYAALDTRVNEGWPAYEKALKENKKEYTTYMYENANHGFHNDTTPRYDKAAAELAWKRTIDFFGEKLK